jgi:hypothetical protein
MYRINVKSLCLISVHINCIKCQLIKKVKYICIISIVYEKTKRKKNKNKQHSISCSINKKYTEASQLLNKLSLQYFYPFLKCMSTDNVVCILGSRDLCFTSLRINILWLYIVWAEYPPFPLSKCWMFYTTEPTTTKILFKRLCQMTTHELLIIEELYIYGSNDISSNTSKLQNFPISFLKIASSCIWEFNQHIFYRKPTYILTDAHFVEPYIKLVARDCRTTSGAFISKCLWTNWNITYVVDNLKINKKGCLLKIRKSS